MGEFFGKVANLAHEFGSRHEDYGSWSSSGRMRLVR